MTHATSYKMLLAVALLFGPLLSSASDMPDGKKLFKQKCSLCHSLDKKKLGPAVNTMSNKVEVLRKTINEGKKLMPAFENKLTGVQIDALVKYLLAN